MRSRIMRLIKRSALLLAMIAVTLLAVRIYDTQRGAPLEPWHTFVPHELKAKALDGAGWAIISRRKTSFSPMCCMRSAKTRCG